MVESNEAIANEKTEPSENKELKFRSELMEMDHYPEAELGAGP